MGRQLIDFDDALCSTLVDGGFRVIRVDHRDSGLSPRINAGKIEITDVLRAMRAGSPLDAPYRLADMAGDVVRVLDEHRLDSAHVVGASLGGMIGQTLAARHPARVMTLVSIMATTGNPAVGRPASPSAAAVLWTAPPAERAAAISHLVAVRKVLAGGGPIDLGRVRREETAAYDRAFRPDGAGRHFAAVVASGDRTEELASVAAPTLVIHGMRDPLIDPSGGEATAAAIDRARLLTIEGMGHQFTLPEPFRAGIVAAILDHLTGAPSGYW